MSKPISAINMQFYYETSKKIISSTAQLIVSKISMQNRNMVKHNIHFFDKGKMFDTTTILPVPDVRKHVCGDFKCFSVKNGSFPLIINQILIAVQQNNCNIIFLRYRAALISRFIHIEKSHKLQPYLQVICGMQFMSCLWRHLNTRRTICVAVQKLNPSSPPLKLTDTYPEMQPPPPPRMCRLR